MRNLDNSYGTCEQVGVGVFPEMNRRRWPVEVLVSVGGDDQLVTALAAPGGVLLLSRRRKIHRGEGRAMVVVFVVGLLAELVVQE